MESDLFDWKVIRDDLENVRSYFARFVRNPIQALRDIPDWKWPTILLLTTASGAISGFLAGVVSARLGQAVIGLIFLPISTLICVAIFAGFFYYTFLFFQNQTLPFKACFTLCFLAALPILILNILSQILPPATLVATAISGLLLVVGLVDHFKTSRRFTLRLISGLFLAYLVFWIVNSIEHQQRERRFFDKVTTESVDILEKELKGE